MNNKTILMITNINREGINIVDPKTLDPLYNDPNYLLVNRICSDQVWTKVKGSQYLGKKLVTTTFVEGTEDIYIILAELK